MNLQRFRNITVLFTLLLFSAWIGYNLGLHEVKLISKNSLPQVVIKNKSASITKQVDFSLFWDVWQRLEHSYINKEVLDPQNMVWGAISGMVYSLDDPYTVFLPPKENKDTKDELLGTFEGIGAQLGMKDKKIIVIAPLKGMPAETVGILAGDWIIKVDDKDTVGWTLPQAVENIRGPRGSTVTLTILHENDEQPTKIAVVRDTIVVASVEWWIKEVKDVENIKDVNNLSENRSIAYIRLSRFGDTTLSEWEKAVLEISQKEKELKEDLVGLIFDLRNNPGGYLNGAVYIASEFLKDGVVVIQEDAKGHSQTFSVNRKGSLLDIPLIVLVNKGSASASEIVAGSLRDHERAKILGETTFGKGSIQESQDLPEGAGLHITTALWLLPKGDSIDKKGLSPDIEVSLNKEEPDYDKQLEEAIKVLFEKK